MFGESVPRLLDQFSESQMFGCDQDEFSGQKRVRTGTELSRQTLASLVHQKSEDSHTMAMSQDFTRFHSSVRSQDSFKRSCSHLGIHKDDFRYRTETTLKIV